MERHPYVNNPVHPFDRSPCNIYDMLLVPYSVGSLTRIISRAYSILPSLFFPFWSGVSEEDQDERVPGDEPSCQTITRSPVGMEIEENNQDHDDNDAVDMDEVAMVMEGMGMPREEGGGEVNSRLGRTELSRIFDEREPSLEEIKDAFDVFDVNGNGFIEASELQRVLCILGLRQGSDIEACVSMIRAFDEDGDDRIDFKEFLRLMQKCFS